MRTALFLIVGFLLLAACLILGKLFTANFPGAAMTATATFVGLWLIVTGFNMWVGVTKVGYSIGEELPVFLLLFLVPAALAIFLKWKS